MAFKNISEILKTSGKDLRSGRRTSSADVQCSTDKGGSVLDATKRSIPYYAFRISISQEIAKKARILNGDSVTVLFDRDTTPARGLLCRVTSGGWKLSDGGGRNTSKKARLSVKMTYVKGIPSFKHTAGCESVVTDEGILFDLPSDCSFDENLREVK